MCFSAFCAERALPSGVFGPRDFAPFPRLPSTRALLMETAARGAAPALDMAGFLAGWWGLEGRGQGPGPIGRAAGPADHRKWSRSLTKDSQAVAGPRNVRSRTTKQAIHGPNCNDCL